jgi:hypothetical protein
MNVNSKKRLASQSSGTDLTLTGTIKAKKITIGDKDVTSSVTALADGGMSLSGNLTVSNDTTTTTTTVQELVTTKYITLPTVYTAKPTAGKLGFIISQSSTVTPNPGYTIGNYATPASVGGLTAGVWVIFGNATFNFTSPTSFTKAGVQVTSAYTGNSGSVTGVKDNTLAALEYPTAITTNIPSKITLSIPAYYHTVTSTMISQGTEKLYIVINATFAATTYSLVASVQGIRIA